MLLKTVWQMTPGGEIFSLLFVFKKNLGNIILQ